MGVRSISILKRLSKNASTKLSPTWMGRINLGAKGTLGNFSMPPSPHPASSLSTAGYGGTAGHALQSQAWCDNTYRYICTYTGIPEPRVCWDHCGFSWLPVSCPMVRGKGSAHPGPQRKDSLLILLSCVLDANTSKKPGMAGGEARNGWKEWGIIFPRKDKKLYPKQGISKGPNDGL